MDSGSSICSHAGRESGVEREKVTLWTGHIQPMNGSLSCHSICHPSLERIHWHGKKRDREQCPFDQEAGAFAEPPLVFDSLWVSSAATTWMYFIIFLLLSVPALQLLYIPMVDKWRRGARRMMRRRKKRKFIKTKEKCYSLSV